ncbi:MAG TPA: response regulator [Chitinophagaceae bacterium]|nr:response regulator [Chitinophagaceae bacterium]
MKNTSKYFIWIVLFAIGLMVTILVTQVNTTVLLKRLQEGNKQAVLTFSINNRLQEMVNQSFELENKFINNTFRNQQTPYNGLRDSLTRAGYNASVLLKAWTDTTGAISPQPLVKFVEKQIGISFQLLEAAEDKNEKLIVSLTDSLRNAHCGDSIYVHAISFQQLLENNLSNTLQRNYQLTNKLSLLNSGLAILSMGAIIILATVIIRRQRRQLSLIRDLDESKTEALHLANAKNQFLATMSHEIRTPLNALLGYSKLLNETPLDSQQKKYAGIISTASDNLLNLVNDILDFAKIEANTLTIRKIPFSLADLLDETETMFVKQAAEKGLELRFSNPSGADQLLLGDPLRIRQVLVNLISNAIKFTDKGTVKVYTALKEKDAATVGLEMVVQDTGIGIPADKLESIFERFEQIDNSLSRQYGGTGLGLAITRKLVEMMGGDITVKSEVNHGSLFQVKLLLEKRQEEKLADTKQQQTIAGRREAFSDIAVLIVEDNPMNRSLLEILLEKKGMQYNTVTNGKEALHFLETQLPDIVLMDVQMPEIDGLQTTRLIREKFGHSLPVIAMTAHVLPGEKERCLAAGMTDYLTKPIDTDKLYSLIGQYSGLKENESNPQISGEGIDWKKAGLSYLSSICNGDSKKIKTILGELDQQLPQDIRQLEKAITDRDRSGLKTICHHLRSTLSPLDEDSEAMKAFLSFSAAARSAEQPDWQALSIQFNALSETLEGALENLEVLYK